MRLNDYDDKTQSNGVPAEPEHVSCTRFRNGRKCCCKESIFCKFCCQRMTELIMDEGPEDALFRTCFIVERTMLAHFAQI